MDATTTPATEPKGFLKHTPKVQMFFMCLGVIYFMLAIYFVIVQIKHHHKVNG
jgi:hypothetical protein